MSRSLVEVWFWVDDPKSKRYHKIFAGEISFNLASGPVFKISNGEKLYKIISHDGFIIDIAYNRLYDTEKECLSALREYKLNKLYNE